MNWVIFESLMLFLTYFKSSENLNLLMSDTKLTQGEIPSMQCEE